MEAMLKAEATTFAFKTEALVLTEAHASYNLSTDGAFAFLADHLHAKVLS